MDEKKWYTIEYKGYSQAHGHEIRFRLGQMYDSIDRARDFLKSMGVETDESNIFWIKPDKKIAIDENEDLLYAFGSIIAA